MFAQKISLTNANMKAIKTRLAALSFLEFAVWGSYLVSLGLYLGSVGLGGYIFWFYTVQGLVSLIMPGLVGVIADRFIPAQKILNRHSAKFSIGAVRKFNTAVQVEEVSEEFNSWFFL